MNETIDLEAELRMVQERYTSEEEARKRRAVEQELLDRKRRRRELLEDVWRPYCRCKFCLRQILSLSNERCERWGSRGPEAYEHRGPWIGSL